MPRNGQIPFPGTGYGMRRSAPSESHLRAFDPLIGLGLGLGGGLRATVLAIAAR